MYISRRPFHFGAAAVIFLLLKAYHSLTDSLLLFLLKPVALLVEVGTGASSVFAEGEGYRFSTLNIIIDNSCSGFNFMLISFMVLVVAVLQKVKEQDKAALLIPVTLIFAYGITVFVNAARILSAIWLGRVYPAIKNLDWAHEALGAFVYLSFLLLVYSLAHFLLNQLTHNAKPAQP